MERAGALTALPSPGEAARRDDQRAWPAPAHTTTRSAGPFEVEIVVPAYNEAAGLEASMTTLRHYLDESFPFRTLVTIADNGSTDGTALIAQRLATTMHDVSTLILSRKGKGHALRAAWSASRADVVAYMDVDLSTSLTALLPLVGSVLSGHSDLAVGTRLARGSRVVRGPKRELLSRAYSRLVRLALRSDVSDFQCGFKAIGRERALQLLPLVDDEGWFFDTELVVTAERLGMRISETPVEWTDDPHSSVHILEAAREDLRGIWRLARTGRTPRSVPGPPPPARRLDATSNELLSFAGVGVLSTLSYLLLFAFGWPRLGPVLANAVSVAFCTVVNTAVHRSLAHGRRAPGPSFATVVAALYGVSLAATTAAIALTDALVGSSLTADAVAATAACCVAGLVRFSLLRGWAYPPPPGPDQPAPLRPLPG